MWESLICSNWKSQFLDKKEKKKVQDKHEEKEMATDK